MKPYLYIDSSGNWGVFVPSNRTSSQGGDTIRQTADVNGIRIGGLIFDAGTTNSSVLVRIGPAGASASHASDPAVLTSSCQPVTIGEGFISCKCSSGRPSH